MKALGCENDLVPLNRGIVHLLSRAAIIGDVATTRCWIWKERSKWQFFAILAYERINV